MGDIERDYYLVQGGKTKEIIDRFLQRRHEVQLRWEKFKEQHDADHLWGTRTAIGGLIFKTRPPDPGMWRPSKEYRREKVFVPNKRTKSGKMIAKILASPDFVKQSGFNLTSSLGLESIIRGNLLCHVGLEFFGHKTILSVPLKEDGTSQIPPTKMKKLKKSEYWKIREAAEAKEKKGGD